MKNFRKRTRDGDSDAEDAGAAPSAAAARLAVQQRLSAAGRPAAPPPAPAPAAAPAPAPAASLARALGGGHLAEASAAAASGVSSSAALQAVPGGAFAAAEATVAPERDGRARLEHSVALQRATLAELEGGGQRTYRGAAGYVDFRSGPRDAKEVVAAAKHSGALGPSRAPANVRGICRVDYAPDVCKDWKETGQCPFGDACIFLHDRGDYKSGWQIERDWAAAKKDKERRVAEVLAAGGTLEEAEALERAAEGGAGGGGGGGGAPQPPPLPFACHICRGPFQAPVQTACGHYFCEGCALERNRASPDCAFCGAPTHGIFHAAPKLRAAMLERKAKEGGGEGAGGGGGGGGDDSGAGGGGGGGGAQAAQAAGSWEEE